MLSLRRPLPVLLTVLGALALAAPASASAAPRGEARTLLAPQVELNRAIDAHRSELSALSRDWQRAHDACLKPIDEPPIDQNPGALAGVLVLVGVVTLDAFQEVMAPVQDDVRAAADRWRTMKLTDPTLRAGARAQAREIDTLLALPPVDSCQIVKDWIAGGYKLSAFPSWVTQPSPAHARDRRAITRAVTRLRRLGAGAKQASGFASGVLGGVG